MLLGASGAALSEAAYAGTPVTGLLTGSAAAQKAVTGALQPTAQPVSAQSVLKPPPPSAAPGAGAAPPAPAAHTLTAVTSAAAPSQATTAPSQAAGTPAAAAPLLPGARTLAPELAQPQAPARSVVTPVSAAASQVAGVASHVPGGQSPAAVGSATRVAPLLVPPPVPAPPGAPPPAGTMGADTQQLIATAAPAAGAIHRSLAGALATVTSAVPGGPAPRSAISRVLPGTLTGASGGGSPPAVRPALNLLSAPVLSETAAPAGSLPGPPVLRTLTGLTAPVLRTVVEAAGLAVAPAAGVIHRSLAGALATVTSAVPGGPALRRATSRVLPSTLTGASGGGLPPAVRPALNLLSAPVLPETAPPAASLPGAPVLRTLTGLTAPVLRTVVEATGLAEPPLRTLAEATGLAAPALPAAAELPGLSRPSELNPPALGPTAPGFPQAPGAGHGPGGGAGIAASGVPPPRNLSHASVVVPSGPPGRIADPAPAVATAQASSGASAGPRAAAGCVLAGLEERIMESCGAGGARPPGALTGPAQLRGPFMLLASRAPPWALQTEAGPSPHGRPDVHPAPAPAVPAGLPDGVPGSAAAGAGPGVAMFLLITCVALLAALLAARLLGVSGQAWRSAPFALIPERPG